MEFVFITIGYFVLLFFGNNTQAVCCMCVWGVCVWVCARAVELWGVGRTDGCTWRTAGCTANFVPGECHMVGWLGS